MGGGHRLAQIVRDELGLGYAPVADLPALCERHFGLNAVTWPIGKAVSGLCAHGADIALVLVSSSFHAGISALPAPTSSPITSSTIREK